MNNVEKPQKLIINDWPFRLRLPLQKSDQSPMLLLLHGHLGNENVMWSLTKPIPDTYLILCPRAPVVMGENQYSWHKISPNWPTVDTYKKLTDKLLSTVNLWVEKQGLPISHYDVMGFSQGAVMAYGLAIIYPQLIRKVAALSGFIPQSWMKTQKNLEFENTEFFIAHGRQDQIIPIQNARQTINWLGQKNAKVTVCETETGHKLSVDCFNKLGEFFL